MPFSFIVIPGPDNCTNPFKMYIFTTYCCNSIWNDGIYIFSEYVFLWEYFVLSELSTVTVDPSESVPFFLCILLFMIVCGISYPSGLCNKLRVCFWCALWEAFVLPYSLALLVLGYLSWFCTFLGGFICWYLRPF